jgi:cellulose 1,4-beta-cellobiosidase
VIGIVAATSSSTYSYTDTGLSVGKTYYYVVTAVNSTYGTKSTDSTQVSAVPLPPPPLPPTNVAATAGVQQITVTWIGSLYATGYHLDRATVSGGPYTLVAAVPTGTNNSYSYSDTGLTVGKTYYYVVTAVNSTNGTKSANSTQVSAVPSPPAPLAPTNVAATPGVQLVTITWTGSAGATGYHVDIATKSGGPYTLVTAVPTGTGNSYSYTDTGLTSSKTYYFVVTAVNSTYGTKSANSTQVSAVAD